MLLDARSLWLDEHYTIFFAMPEASWPEFFEGRLSRDTQPPLYYALAHAWLGLFGESPVALRALNLLGLAGLAATLLWWRGRDLSTGRRSLFWLLLLTSIYAWFYAVEGRAYFLTFVCASALTLMAADAAGRLARAGRIPIALLAALCVTAHLAGGLHYFGFLYGGCVLLALFGFALLRRAWRSAVLLAAGGLLMAGLLAGWLIFTMPGLYFGSAAEFWLPFQPVRTLLEFARDALSLNPVLAFAIAASAVLAFSTVALEAEVLIVVVAGTLTVIAALAISLVQPMLLGRYLIVLAPPVAYVASRLLWAARPRWLMIVAVASALLISLPIAVTRTRVSAEDWRGAARYIDQSFGARCDRAAFMADRAGVEALPQASPYFMHLYYARGRAWEFLPPEAAYQARALEGTCPIVAWIGRADFQEQFHALNWPVVRLSQKHFGRVLLVYRADG